MSKTLITLLIVGQILIDLAIAFSLWAGSIWQTKVTDILLGQGLF